MSAIERDGSYVTPPVPPATIAAYEQKIDMLLRELHKYES